MQNQNPFSIYDFLGYLIPGSLTLYILLFVNSSKTHIDVIDLTVNNYGIFELDRIFLFVIVSYSIGHLINFISSITIERYANWKYNYPSKYLMDFNGNFRFWSGSPKSKSWKVFLMFVVLPITFWDFVLGEKCGFKTFYTKKTDDYIIELVKKKGSILMQKIGAPSVKGLKNFDFHRIFSHYAYEYSKNHQSKLNNYVALYGFLRSLSAITILSFWLLLWHSYKSEMFITETSCALPILTLISLISYIFFMAFMKFYRRYSLEGLMIIAIDKELA